MRITPVILAGGQGKRLRPLTSEKQAKPFLRVFSEYSLLQQTLMRLPGFAPPVIVGGQEHEGQIIEHLAEIGCVPYTIICEPMGRSTAAAITMAALELNDPEGEDTVMAIMPSDHVIAHTGVFQDAVKFAAEAATQYEVPALLGVRPRSASTRYGYIQVNAEGGVEGFVEKPNRRTAKVLIENGQFYWNTGIFCVRPQDFLSLVERYAPAIYTQCSNAYRQGIRRGVCVYPDSKNYAECPSVAVDYAVMEHVKSARFITLETGWGDVGTWPALYKLGKEQYKRTPVKKLTNLR